MNADDAPLTAPLVCQRISRIPTPPVSSFADNCALCASSVWVAFSSPQGHPIWCWDCAGKEIAKADKGEIATPSPSQMEDIEAYWRDRPGRQKP